MSDSEEDWEKQLEDEEALEKNLNQDKKKAFVDEDAYDSEEEKKKKLEEQKSQPQQPGRKKESAKKDYDLMFQQRLAASKGSNAARVQEEMAGKNLSKEARAELMSKAAELDITESLFADINIDSKSLMTEKDYVNFGKKVASVLYEGQAPYKIPVFFKEALRDVQSQLESKRIKEILDNITTLYNEKVKEEKEKDKAGKSKQKKQPQLAAGKQTVNQQLMHDLMGEDDYGEEEYGAETSFPAAKKKVQEADFDFM